MKVLTNLKMKYNWNNIYMTMPQNFRQHAISAAVLDSVSTLRLRSSVCAGQSLSSAEAEATAAA